MIEVRRSLLIVDDDDTFRRRLARALTDRGFEVREAADSVAARRLAEEESPEFATVDLRLRAGLAAPLAPSDDSPLQATDGLELVRALHALDQTTRIVVLTGYGSIATAVSAMRCGAADYVTKPADADQIERALLGTPPSADAAPSELAAPSLARVEWEHIQRVLHDTGYNVSQAARVLGIHRRSLQRKLGKDPVGR
jgi:two-component system, response regulator RegA